MKRRRTRSRTNHFHKIVSSHANEVKIDKSEFEFDLFWSIQDGTVVKVDNLVDVYSRYSNTKNMKVLVSQFGKKRVINIMKRNRKANWLAYKRNMEIINDSSTKSITSKNLAPFVI